MITISAMGLGAAGCGYEYDNPDYKCNHLTSGLFGFRCFKYSVDLKTHERLKHPMRCNICSDEAHKDAWSDIMKERKLITCGGKKN